jgi:hypothetical protein
MLAPVGTALEALHRSIPGSRMAGRAAPRSRLAVRPGDDRQAIALLMLPVLLIALAIGVGQTLRPTGRPVTTGRPTTAIAALPEKVSERRALPARAGVPRTPLPALAVEPPVVAAVDIARAAPEPVPARSAPDANLVTPTLLAPAPEPLPTAPWLAENASVAQTAPGLPLVAAEPEATTHAAVAPSGRRPEELAALGGQAPSMPSAASEPAFSAPVVGGREVDWPAVGGNLAGESAVGDNVCHAPLPAQRPRSSASVAAPRDPLAFGLALAAAAKSQTREFVVYNDKYRRIAYPMGDVPSFYGVCTDVVIRAYRELGIDLQVRVQAAGVGSGDTSIDHRRVDTLRRFFAAQGAALPVTDHAEDYRPGDIVSYWRPQNRHSRTHIAVVSDEVGPSGRLMIIHNRGWGPQIEDGLFVDQITGHYRFGGGAAAAVDADPTAARQAPTRGAAAIAARASTPTITGGAPAKAGAAGVTKPAVVRRREAGVTRPQTAR